MGISCQYLPSQYRLLTIISGFKMVAKGCIYVMSISAIAITGCKKPYNPVIVTANANYLVVEGVINSGQDSTVIHLSRTINISDTTKVNPELGAQVTVESDQNTTYPLQELGKGVYASPFLNLDAAHKYHLRIKTSDGKE